MVFTLRNIDRHSLTIFITSSKRIKPLNFLTSIEDLIWETLQEIMRILMMRSLLFGEIKFSHISYFYCFSWWYVEKLDFIMGWELLSLLFHIRFLSMILQGSTCFARFNSLDILYFSWAMLWYIDMESFRLLIFWLNFKTDQPNKHSSTLKISNCIFFVLVCRWSDQLI